MTTLYRLPHSLGSQIYPGRKCGCLDSTTVEIDLGSDNTLHVPEAILTIIASEPDTGPLRFDLAQPLPAQFSDYSGHRMLIVDHGKHAGQIKLQVAEGDLYGRAAILRSPQAEAAAWTILGATKQ